MKVIFPSGGALRIAMLLASTAACAAGPQEKAGVPVNSTLPEVTVTALRDPVDKSYRKMVDGMNLFQERHGMAPEASLRYKLLPRQPGTQMTGIRLAIEAESFALPVAVARDQTFTLERNQKALEEDASVKPNRRAGSMTWRAEIRTPGLPPDSLRLGDLRLECHVGIEADLVSNRRPSLFGAIASFLEKPGYCEARKPQYLFFAERPLFGVTLVSGTRREVLSVDDLYAGLSRDGISADDLPYCDCQVLLDRTYYLPLGDHSWPDDTLVEFEYMDGPAANQDIIDAVAVGKSTRSDVLAALGNARVISFDNGYDEWIYRFAAEAPANETPARTAAVPKTEFVVLFAASGIVAKTRLRPAPRPGAIKGA